MGQRQVLGELGELDGVAAAEAVGIVVQGTRVGVVDDMVIRVSRCRADMELVRADRVACKRENSGVQPDFVDADPGNP